MRNSKMLAAAATVAVAVSACATGASELSGEAPDVLVTDDVAVTRTHEAPSLHVDQDDSDIVYLSESELQSGDCRFYVSTDRGATWTAEASTVDSPLESDKAEGAAPSPEVEGHDNCTLGTAGAQNIRTELDQAPDGTLYYTFHANDPNAEGSRSVLVARSRDDGRTFETTVVDAGDEPGDEIEVNFQAHTAIDPDNPSLMYTMWRRSFEAVGEEDRPPTRPFMAVSEDGGVTYSKPTELLDINPGFDGPRPVVVDGQVFAFYRESAPSSDDGEEANTMLQVIESDDQGQTWSEPTVISAELDASEPIPLYDREENRFHVVFHDNRHGDLDIFHTTSVDGEEWSEPQRLNDDEVENDFGQYYPQISQSPNGRIDVAWYDYRDDPGPPPAADEPGERLGLGSNLGVLQSVYYTSSTDGGETWSENVRVNDVAIDRSIGTWNGQFFVVVPLSITSWDDRALVAWSDTRNGTNSSGTQDIFASAITAGDDDDAASAVVPVIAVLGAVLLGAGLALLAAVVLMRRSRQDD